jgi:hypothetical protein
LTRLYQDHFLPILAGNAGKDGDASYYRKNDTLSLRAPTLKGEEGDIPLF